MAKRFFPRLTALAGILISAATVVWLAKAYDWRAAIQASQDAQPGLIAISPLVLLANFIVRAVRWRGLFPPSMSPRLSSAFTAMMAGQMFNIFSPARVGDLVRVHLLGSRDRLPRSAALGTVVVERTLDLIVLLALLAFALLSQPLPVWAATSGKVTATLACAASVALGILIILGERLIAAVVPAIPFLPVKLLDRLQESGRNFVHSLSVVLGARAAVSFIVLTIAIWALDVLFVYVIAQAFSMPLGIANVVFVMVAITVGSIVPSSPGYIGTYEFFGVSALSALSIQGEHALAFIIVLHAVYLLGSGLIGGACLAFSGWPRLPVENNGDKFKSATKI